MRAREVERIAKRIVRDELGKGKFELFCPPHLRAKGTKGDEPHISKVVFLTAWPDEEESLSDFYERIAQISARICGEIDDVSRVTLNLTALTIGE